MDKEIQVNLINNCLERNLRWNQQTQHRFVEKKIFKIRFIKRNENYNKFWFLFYMIHPHLMLEFVNFKWCMQL